MNALHDLFSPQNEIYKKKNFAFNEDTFNSYFKKKILKGVTNYYIKRSSFFHGKFERFQCMKILVNIFQHFILEYIY